VIKVYKFLYNLFLKYYEEILIKAAGTEIPDVNKDVPPGLEIFFVL
jgi:hypothetical protein